MYACLCGQTSFAQAPSIIHRALVSENKKSFNAAPLLRPILWFAEKSTWKKRRRNQVLESIMDPFKLVAIISHHSLWVFYFRSKMNKLKTKQKNCHRVKRWFIEPTSSLLHWLHLTNLLTIREPSHYMRSICTGCCCCIVPSIRMQTLLFD